MALFRWPLYFLGAWIAIPTCFSIWVRTFSSQIAMHIPGLFIDLSRIFVPGQAVIEDYGGLIIVLMIPAIVLLDLITSRSERPPKVLLVTSAAILTIAACYVFASLQPLNKLLTGMNSGVWVSPDLARIVYGSLLVFVATLWGFFFTRCSKQAATVSDGSGASNVHLATGRWFFYFRWLLANAGGMTLGICVASLTEKFLSISLYTRWWRLWFAVWPSLSSQEREVLELFRQSIALLPYGFIFGASIGLTQWLVLRGYLGHSFGWIPASALGWALSWSVGFGVNYWRLGAASANYSRYLHGYGSFAGLFLFIGLTVGIIQYFLFWRQVHRSGWWILASAAGGVVAGSLLGRVPDSHAVLLAAPHEPGTAFLSGLANGAVTGLALLILLLGRVVSEKGLQES